MKGRQTIIGDHYPTPAFLARFEADVGQIYSGKNYATAKISSGHCELCHAAAGSHADDWLGANPGQTRVQSFLSAARHRDRQAIRPRGGEAIATHPRRTRS